jgi:hypothetical protein
MSQHAATPGEMVDFAEALQPLPADRADGAIKMLTEVVGKCPGCDEAVRRCDPRRLIDGSLYHLSCALRPLPIGRPGTGR